MSPSLKELGTAPSAQAIDQFMLDLGLKKRVVGRSVQGRELLLYELQSLPRKQHQHQQHSDTEMPTVLFLSLVHGNEPQGLFALLFCAQLLSQSSLRGPSLPNGRILFFPIVNIDAYTLNVEFGNGCRRTNLQGTCVSSSTSSTVSACPSITHDGVDLNRNFPMDWMDDSSLKGCGINNHGPSPFSEPESRAVRDIVLESNVSAAMSFHSRNGLPGQQPLLIHPFTSLRPLDNMPVDQQARYRKWSKVLSANSFPFLYSNRYIAGTAMEAINYPAGGSTIDWMQSQNVTAFIMESLPPCDNRWCSDVGSVMKTAYYDGGTARKFAELALNNGKLMENGGAIFVVVIAVVIMVLVAWLMRHQLLPLLRRMLRAKEKQMDESEMRPLSAV